MEALAVSNDDLLSTLTQCRVDLRAALIEIQQARETGKRGGVRVSKPRREILKSKEKKVSAL